MQNKYFKPKKFADALNDKTRLNIICKNCKKKKVKNCIICILSSLDNNLENVSNITINNSLSLRVEEINLIICLKKFYLKLKKKNKLIKCSNGQNFCNNTKINDIFLSDFNEKSFIDLLEFLLSGSSLEHLENSSTCYSCLKKIRKKLKIFQKEYFNSNLYKLIFLKYGKKNITAIFFFNLFPTLKEIQKITTFNLNINEYNQIDQYLFSNQLYEAKIYVRNNIPENLYQINYNISKNIQSSLDLLLNFFKDKLYDLDFAHFTDLGKKITYIKNQIEILIQNYLLDTNFHESEKISLILTIKFLNIEKLFPFLCDPFIEEIFQDSNESNIYIDHTKCGRCITCIKLDPLEFDALKTHLILESKQRLDEQHPSIVHFMNNLFFNCRFSIDISPSHWRNIALDIRKLNKMIFTLSDLIDFHTLSIEMASFLVFCILFRKNITIAGEVNSGKTTLLNALDLYVPSHFRKIYIEETIETLEYPSGYGHQLKYLVSPERDGENNNKEKEIYKLLHRSGDLIVLGEILSKLETNALFHCLSAGLRGFQTTHASSINGLLNRWLIHFQIDKTCLNDLDIVIVMKKIGDKRIIQTINEIFYDNINDKIEIHAFYEYNPKLNQWNKTLKFEDSIIFKDINKIINFSEKKFNKIISLLNSSFKDEKKDDLTGKHHIYFPLKNIYSKLKSIEQYIGGI